MNLHDLDTWLAAHGANASHRAFVLRRWLQALPEDVGPTRPAHYLPQRLQRAMAQDDSPLNALVRERSAHPGDDGAVRLLLALQSGQTIESVLLPRGGLCVSTQVGCAVGCTFCMTGRDGLIQQLGSAEIVAQVAHARRQRAVKKVVFMGMGEPAHNLDAVCEAIELLGTAGGIAHKNLVFSTVGDERAFARLPALRVKPALALSLHSTFADKREKLLPRAPRIAPAALVDHAERYARATTYPVQFQWTLLEGINDGDDEVAGIARLLAGKYAVMNLIPFNRVDGSDYRRPRWERAAEIARTLHRQGILTKLRHSAGQEVDGGCGQLRSREQPVRMPPRRPAGASAAA
ncbi:MAG: RNA methyltransferase [Burkholderiaceae bacterium]|nr:RNA methyltransferase [Burkholderiaceae bacterium]